jgi:importin-4
MPVFAQVLSPPEEQLDDETREKIIETVRYLAKERPGLVQGNEVLIKALHG